MRTSKLPNAIHEAHMTIADATSYPKAKAFARPNNTPTKERIEAAYTIALRNNDKQAMAALLDAYDVVCPLP